MDRVLTLNVGSSSLKWSLFDERDWLVDGGEGASLDEIAARIGEADVVVHRIVHGAQRFVAPCEIDASVRRALEELVPLDALHMRPALDVLDEGCERWSGAKHIAAFDTAFHATLDEVASTYAVPRAWRERGVRRYGFHGLSVAYAAASAPAIARRALRRMIVCHLGSGASITAVLDGRSVDTTMGMTPLDGVVMATRSGSIDPGALIQLLRDGTSVDELEEGLARRGGLFALSGQRDMRVIAASNDPACVLARAHFIRSVAKHACAMFPALGGLDAVVFTGGIGEGDAGVRSGVLESLPCGIELNSAVNARSEPTDRVISTASSPVLALVIRAREDVMMLRAARQRSCSEDNHEGTPENSRRDRLQ